MNAQYVWIDGVAFSPKHPKVLALAKCEQLVEVAAVNMPKPKPAKRIRQDSKPTMNKLEQAWFEKIKQDLFTAKVYVQAMKFKLCNGVTYCPDFVVVQHAGHMICYETKGFMRDDAAIKIKMAAKEFPNFTWILAWKESNEWKTQTIFP